MVPIDLYEIKYTESIFQDYLQIKETDWVQTQAQLHNEIVRQTEEIQALMTELSKSNMKNRIRNNSMFWNVLLNSYWTHKLILRIIMEFNAYQIMEKVSLLNKPLFHLNLSLSDLNTSPPYKYAVRVYDAV